MGFYGGTILRTPLNRASAITKLAATASELHAWPAVIWQFQSEDRHALALQFYHAFQRGRSFTDWLEPELVLAASLAKCCAQIEELQTMFEDPSSHVIADERGKLSRHPSLSLLKELTDQRTKLFAQLKLNALADVRTLKGSAMKEQELRNNKGEISGLLA